jgi:hypothetical protein
MRSPSSAIARSVASAGINRVLAGFAVILLCLAGYYFPISPDVHLDPSWQMALTYGWSHHWIYGQDIVFTYGPWGWLTTRYHDTDTFLVRFAWELVWKTTATLFFVRAAWHLSTFRRCVALLAGLLILPLVGDTLPTLVIAGAGAWGIRRYANPPIILILVGAALGFLSLQKFTYLALSMCAVSGVTLRYLMGRDYRRGTIFIVSWSTSLLAGWLIAGQPISALPHFLQRSFWISADYSSAMGLEESRTIFWFGLASVVTFFGSIWRLPVVRNLPMFLMLTGCAFVSWKQGFVRADGHAMGFFHSMIFAGLAAPLCIDLTRFNRAASAILVVIAVSGSIAVEPGLASILHYLLRDHISDSINILPSPQNFRRKLDEQFTNQRIINDLPQVRTTIGTAGIDQFGYEQAVVLLNGFNYRPRPVLQGYQAYSGRLSELNQNFYLSPAAPEFTLVRLQTIDGRYPTLDDAAVLPLLITDHDWLLSEKGFTLLRRHANPAALELVPLASGRLRYGTEAWTLESPTTHGIWAMIDAPLSWLGWLRTIFYKAPVVTLVLSEQTGLEKRFRLVTSASRDGFLLSPMLLDTADFDALSHHHSGRPPAGFRLEIDPRDAKFFLKRARFELFTVPSIDFQPLLEK